MKSLVLLIAIFPIFAGAQNYEASLRFGTFYETNTFYESENQNADEAFLLEPHISYESTGRYSIRTDSNVSYTKYFSNTNQDFFTYDLNLKNNLKLGNSFQVYVTPKAKLLSEPALAESEDRLERQFLGGALGFLISKDPRRQYIFELEYQQENLSQLEYNYLNNQSITGHFFYKRYFLPETFVYFGIAGGIRTYPDGKKASNLRYKYDSQHIEPGFGLEGRLTRYFKIRSYFGYSLIQYTKDVNYQDPVFLLELEEEMSPKVFLLLGLQNDVEDSYFTNFQINQKVYAGYGRFLGDQFLWVSKIEYLYRTYSRPQRRDDQRLVANTSVEYSYSQKLKIEASLLFDVLSSDAVDPDGPPTPIDPSASYQNIRFGIYGNYTF